MVQVGKEVAVAFALTCCAGAATLLGGALIFSSRLLNRVGSDKFLAGSLGMTAGVMIYVSCMEIFQESNQHFVKSGIRPADAYTYTTLCFFAGFVVVGLLDMLVHAINPADCHGVEKAEIKQAARQIEAAHQQHRIVSDQRAGGMDGGLDMNDSSAKDVVKASGTLHDSVVRVDRLGGEGVKSGAYTGDAPESSTVVAVDGVSGESTAASAEEQKKRRLHRTGMLTALAITLHNFPEGLATFVGALHDPAVGGALALAIAVHNIPEGLAVGVPMYFATGSAKKAFGYVCISAAAEPFAALVAWLVLSSYMTDVAFAVLFGLVGGIMTLVSIKELLPSAVMHDPEDKVVSKSVVLGMVVMAASLVAFNYV